MAGTKERLLADAKTVFDDWEESLAGRDEAEIAARRLPGGRSIQDVVAHLHAWQQLSNARLEAALDGSEPRLPAWLGGADPFFADEHVDGFNARILEENRDRSWSSVHRDWRDGCRTLLALAADVPEDVLLDADRFPWLHGLALSAVLEGWCEHHRQHLEAIPARRG